MVRGWCAVLVVCLVAVMVAEASGGPVRVRVLPAVTLDTSTVRLGQIAEVVGDADRIGSLREVVVADAIVPGEGSELQAWRISARLSEAGCDMTDLAIVGSAACRVSVVAGAGVEAPPSERLGRAGEKARATTLESHIRRMIRDRLRGLPADSRVTIRFNPTVKTILALTDPPYAFQVDRGQGRDRWLGLLGFRVTLYKGAKRLKTVPIQAKVSVSARMLVARRTINRKAVIGEHDVQSRWQPVTRVNMPFVSDLSAFSAGRAKRVIREGTILTSEMVEPQPLVKRGKTVSVIFRRGPVAIRTTAVALETGFKDQLITLRNERSKGTYQGRPIRPGVVLVDMSSESSEVIRP